MLAILCAVVSIFAFRFRGRTSLEIELIALRHQVTVLRRQRPGRLHLSSLDRLLWGVALPDLATHGRAGLRNTAVGFCRHSQAAPM
jgi:hypothetical protein